MLLTLATLLTAGAAFTRPVLAADKADAPYVHAVIFYLKKDAPKDQARAMIADAHEILAKIPSVRMVKAGLPAQQATPKLAVTDYQVGLLIMVDNFDGLKAYLDHPMHLKYVEKHEKHIDKVLVYDFLNQSK